MDRLMMRMMMMIVEAGSDGGALQKLFEATVGFPATAMDRKRQMWRQCGGDVVVVGNMAA